MRKSTRIVKRLLALLLVVLMSIDIYAAVVGDNDGAAFITKAEFDSMKNGFQSQLDRYNSSIDNKIDGAIASYLAGITVAKVSTLVDMITPAKNKNTHNVGFVRWETPNASKDTPDVQAGFYWSRLWGAGGGRTDKQWSGGWIISNGAAWSGAIRDYRYHNWTDPETDFDSYYYLVRFPFGETDPAQHRTTVNTADWTLYNSNRQRCNFKLRSNVNGFSWGTLDAELSDFNDIRDTTFLTDFTAGSSVYTYGPGFGADSTPHQNWYGVTQPTLYISHSWTIWPDVSSGDDDIKRKALKLDYLVSGPMTGTTKGIDFEFRDSYTPDNPYELQIAAYRPSNNGNGGESGSQLALQLYDAATGYFSHLYSQMGWAAYNNNIKFNWKWNRQTIYNLSWDRMTHEYYNGVFSEPYYKYVGIPICRTPNKPGKLRFKLRFINKVLTTGANLTPDSASNGYVYVITDKKFKNTSLPTTGSSDSYWRDSDGYDHVFLSKWVDSGSYEHTTDWIEIDKTKIIDTTNGDYIYLKVAALTNDQVVSVQVVDNITYTEE